MGQGKVILCVFVLEKLISTVKKRLDVITDIVWRIFRDRCDCDDIDEHSGDSGI